MFLTRICKTLHVYSWRCMHVVFLINTAGNLCKRTSEFGGAAAMPAAMFPREATGRGVQILGKQRPLTTSVRVKWRPETESSFL